MSQNAVFENVQASQLRDLHAYAESRKGHWDNVARSLNRGHNLSGSYHRRLEEIYRFLVPPGLRVLELGCGTGDLLAATAPSLGIGIDFSGEMLAIARDRHPRLRFLQGDVHELAQLPISKDEPFDIVIVSDLLNDVWDVQAVLEQVAPHVNTHTRVIINSYSRLWEIPLGIAEKLGLANPVLHQNWLTVEDISGLLQLSGYHVIRSWQEILFPLPIPLLARLANKFLAKLPFFRSFALTNFIVAHPIQQKTESPGRRSVSVIVPARNEAGNIAQILQRVPEMGSGTELIFVEGHSKDDTFETIEREMGANPQRRCVLLRQTGRGKGDAVRLGFSHASGDILMILDADLTVPPEDLPRFYDAIASGKGEFISGVRLTYPMEEQAMRFANLLGNKFFSLAFSALLGQPIKDTLCGTKVILREDYARVAANRAYFGDFDPFGDFDLIFGAAKLNLRITEVPIRYRQRTYGTTNIQRWRHGWLLLKMVVFASTRIKFV
jgi:SAM-dependent methyltransferase